MKYLNQLLPAEALLVYEGKDCSLRRYLKAGFMHLLLRRVLKVQKDGRGADVNGQADRLVIAGPEFLTYRAAACEAPLLTLFDSSPYGQEGFWFSQVVKVAYQKAGTKNSYVQKICNDSNNPGWYKKGFWQQLFGGVSLTNEGWQVQQAIKKEINALEATLPELLTNAPENAQHILRQIKGNVFLLANIDLAALSIAEKDLLAQLDKKEQGSSSDGYVSSCGSGCSPWDNYSEYSGSWDSSCSSDSGGSGGDSGGGDGGSGCSGCGGCGGGD